MKYERTANVLAPPTRAGRAGDFLLNLGWSLYWLARAVLRILTKRKGLLQERPYRLASSPLPPSRTGAANMP